MPKLSKISPIQGVKRLVDMRAFMRLVMNLLKLALIAAIAMWVIHNDLLLIIKLAELTPLAAFLASGNIIYGLAIKLAVLLFVLALLDYMFQRWQHERDLRMSKHDVKMEMKNMDGDPLVKQRRARVARQMAMQRMAHAVPQADVIVTNPTHYAIALRYDADTMQSPKVIAKGADFMAMRIRQIALANDIPLVERKSLAQVLYRTVDVGREVPAEFYNAVAEIMAYVYRLRRRSA
jgi:flagellar biosynthetic protein FlhB